MATLTFTREQRQAIEALTAFVSGPGRTFILSGHAGTGKTTVIEHFARQIGRERKTVLTAPTNKAVKVLKEMTASHGLDRIECRTIYSLFRLTLDGNLEIRRIDYAKGQGDTDAEIIIVDEASMVGEDLFDFIRSFLAEPPRTGLFGAKARPKVIFVGDPLQLPPVKEGHALPFTACDDGFSLTTVVRQALDNPVIRLCERLRLAIESGRTPRIATDLAGQGETTGVLVLDPRQWRESLLGTAAANAGAGAEKSVRAVAWRNRTVDSLNRIIRFALYGETPHPFHILERVAAVSPVMDAPGRAGTAGRALMHTDEEALVTDIEAGHHPMFPEIPAWTLRLRTELGCALTAHALRENGISLYESRVADLRAAKRYKEMFAFIDAFARLRPCHAITAHRSQGSTFDYVFVDQADILANPRRTEALKCLYVACSRTRRILVVKNEPDHGEYE